MSNSSTFDPSLFLQTSVTEANATRLVPVPEGEFQGVIKEINPRSVGNEGRVVMDVTWAVEGAEIKQLLGMDTATVRQSIWLDFTDTGGLDFGAGKNVGLGRLREALKQNTAGKPWSPSNLVGATGLVKVVHSVDKNDSTIIYANVGAVTAL
jgi:hypothetical protein